MVIRTSYDEIGHCDVCGKDFNSEELFDDNMLSCPVCNTQLYDLSMNPFRHIPEFINNICAA